MKINLNILIVTILITFIYSCSEEFDSRTNQINPNTATRTVSEIGSKSINWLDEFRIDIYQNRSNEFSIEDAVIGLDAILNLYKTQEIGNFVRYDVLKNNYAVALNTSGKINTLTLRSLFESIHFDNKEFYENSLLPNKLLGGISIQVKERKREEIVIEVFSVIGENNDNYIFDAELNDELDCQPQFSTEDCYYAGFGDADYIKYSSSNIYSYGSQLIGGGKCDGTLTNETAAHEEVQKKFTQKIPNMVNKSGIPYTVKFVNQECKFINITKNISDYNQFPYSSCSDLTLLDNTINDIEPTSSYNNTELDCAYCIIDNWVKSILPQGYNLSHMNIWTYLTSNFQNSTGWIVEICWGEPVLVPIVDTPIPNEPNGIDDLGLRGNITSNDPFQNLVIPINTIIGK
jgi:hypothetical protein